ncbi:PQQ-dependent sugar dehydrogenase [Alteraurantiacibacter buctensis]|uniref:PQQ-dependent sugar dehydrogenase n=1 Tax=Alteraurantiacibacter buctensis TaxID=1503981 RepID=A0A844Z458_9SPHN|nr:PQQ-dependent sugar dehydrogenase [Alteraurantiacibacter buctensis]MXO72623.1 PQQ-dependent sugar dehydrogenase [Alteraurantiacibacter buctensis]
MRLRILLSTLLPGSLLAASCSAFAAGDSPAPIAAGGTPVELEAGSPFTARAVLNLNEGWSVAVEPGTGNLLVTEKGGTAKYFNPATGDAWEVSGLPAVAYGGQGGLGDVIFAPDYAASRTIYLSWAQAAGEGENAPRRAVAARGQLACAAGACQINDLTEIWRQEPAVASGGHFSHKLMFSPDGRYLFIGSGERMQADPAQDLANNLGKVLRLNPDGTPAAGNPFADRGGVAAQIWSYGHRNLQLAFAPDGRLWELEHGPRGGDEINLVEPGNNYGWPVRSNGNNYNGTDIPDHTADDGFTKPVIFWDPVIAPGDLLIYHGSMFPQFRGQALIAAMSSVNAVVQVQLPAPGEAAATEVARHGFPTRLRDIAEAADGSLWVVEDGPRGRLLHVTAAQ